MKFLHITDPHITKTGHLFKIDVSNQLSLAIDHIIEYHSDAELSIITGDLAHWAEPEAYHKLKLILQRLPMPWHLLIGNHDNRQLLRSYFPDTPTDKNGFIQYVLNTSAGFFIILDTINEGHNHGIICEERLNWLDKRLTEINDQADVYLFMHHAPMITEIFGLDRIRLKNAEKFFNVIKTRTSIRHIFFGHLHRSFHGSWNGIPYSTVKGTAHQVAPDFSPNANLSGSRELPAYATVFLRQDGVFIHDISYLEEEKRFKYN